jgi:hypothetical protein
MNISHRTGHLSRRRAAPRSCLPEGLSARPTGEQARTNEMRGFGLAQPTAATKDGVDPVRVGLTSRKRSLQFLKR